MKNSISGFLKKHNLLVAQNLYVIGFSGGYDSLCLLHILNDISKEYGFKLVAAHLNHKWRAEQSDAEELNARQICRKYGIEFYAESLSADLPHTELEARNQRYDFFQRVAQKYNADALFTGHTSTDNAETLLYRIIKGTGIHGLCGIPEIRKGEGEIAIYRPMLEISRAQTVTYCEEKGLNPNIDSSNADEKYARNSIRQTIMPMLAKHNKDVEEALVRLSGLAKDNEYIVQKYLKAIEKELYKEDEIKINVYLLLEAPVQKRVIYEFLSRAGVEFDNKKINEAMNFINENFLLKSGNTLSIAENTWLFVSSSAIKIIHSTKADVVQSSILVDLNGKVFHQEMAKAVEIQPWQGDKPLQYPCEKSYEAFVDLSGIKSEIFFRTRHKGDIISPFGMQGSMKLKKYLINRGIPEHERDILPLLATENEVLWVVGVGISEKIRVKEVPTHIIKII